MLLNTGRIESPSPSDTFLLYHNSLTPSVANAMTALDKVRIKIGRAFGIDLQTAVEISNECYAQAFEDFVDLARNSPPHNKLEAPGAMAHRNVTEDVRDLLVCWCSLAERLGADAEVIRAAVMLAEVIRAVVMLAEVVMGERYLEEGRNLGRLGLEGVERGELIARFGAVGKEEGKGKGE